jgi:hypothetical protein
MEQMQSRGKESSRERYASVFKSPSFDGLRNKKLMETTADDFFAVFKQNKVAINEFVKRLHNFALHLGWIAIPIVAPYPRFKIVGVAFDYCWPILIQIHPGCRRHLFDITQAFDVLTLMLGGGEGGQEQRSQNRNDGNNHQQFDERKSALLRGLIHEQIDCFAQRVILPSIVVNYAPCYFPGNRSVLSIMRDKLLSASFSVWNLRLGSLPKPKLKQLPFFPKIFCNLIAMLP